MKINIDQDDELVKSYAEKKNIEKTVSLEPGENKIHLEKIADINEINEEKEDLDKEK